jgi:hypothetical protein
VLPWPAGIHNNIIRHNITIFENLKQNAQYNICRSSKKFECLTASDSLAIVIKMTPDYRIFTDVILSSYSVQKYHLDKSQSSVITQKFRALVVHGYCMVENLQVHK